MCANTIIGLVVMHGSPFVTVGLFYRADGAARLEYTLLQEGIEKGIEKGIEEGMEKGMEEGRRKAARNIQYVKNGTDSAESS